METARETRARPEDARPAHANQQHHGHQGHESHRGRWFAWAVLLIAGADGLVLNVWHAVHTSLPTPLAVMVGSVPILLATALTEVVSRTRAGRTLWALTFTVMIGTMGLSVAGQASVLAGPFGNRALAVAYPLIMDLATLVALSTITSTRHPAHNPAHGNADGNAPGNNPYETPPRDVSHPVPHTAGTRGGQQTGEPTGKPAEAGGARAEEAAGQPPRRLQSPSQGRAGAGGSVGGTRKQAARTPTRPTRPAAPSWTVEALASRISEDYAEADVPKVRDLQARYGGRTATVAEAARRVRDARATSTTTDSTQMDGSAGEGPVSHRAERRVAASPAHEQNPGGQQAGKPDAEPDAAPGGKRPPLTAVTPTGDAHGNTNRSSDRPVDGSADDSDQRSGLAPEARPGRGTDKPTPHRKEHDVSYYTLADPAPAVGSALETPDNGTYVTDDPRALSMLYIFDGEPDHESAADLILNTDIVLVRLEPSGDVEQDEDNPHLFAAPGWTVTGIEPTDAVLGPQAPHIRRITALAEDELTGFGPRSDAYVEAMNARYDDAQPHVAAAEAALEAAGADGLEWTGCAYGWELLALAARDLIGTTPEWTQQAYDALTEPWRLVMHTHVHPDDTAPTPAPETR